MAEIVVSTTTNAVDIPEIAGKKLLVSRDKHLVLAKVVERYDSEVAAYGDVINMPWVTDLTANPVVEGNTVTYQANTETEGSINIDQMYEVSFLVHDKYKAQSKYVEMVVSKKIEKAGKALATKIDSTIAALYAGASTNIGDGSTDISKANIMTVSERLNLAEAPQEDRHFVVDAYGLTDLRSEDDFVLYTATGKASPARDGGLSGFEVGRIYEFDVHVSNNIVTQTATPNVIHGLAFQKEAIGLAIQKNITFEKQRKAELLSDLYVSTALWGTAVLRSDHIVDFRYKQG